MRPPRVDDARCARCSVSRAQFSDRSSERLDSAVKIGILFRGTVSHAPLWRFWGRRKNDRWYFIRQQIRFTNAAFTAAFSVASGPREPWLKILDITSHGNIPVELTLNPIAGIFSALVDEHLDGNVFICSKRLRIISIASRCFLYTRPFLPSAVCVFLQIFHLSWGYFRALKSVLRNRSAFRKKEKERKKGRVTKDAWIILDFHGTILHLEVSGSSFDWKRKENSSTDFQIERSSLSLSLYIYIHIYMYPFDEQSENNARSAVKTVN